MHILRRIFHGRDDSVQADLGLVMARQRQLGR
jgi:hypothetical protein